MTSKNILIVLITVGMAIAIYFLYGRDYYSNPELDGYTIMASRLDNKSRAGKAFLTKNINLLVIWQDSCQPCHKILQVLEGVYQDYLDIQVTGLVFGQSEEETQATVDHLGLTFNKYRLQENFLDKHQDYINSSLTLWSFDMSSKFIKPIEAGMNLSEQPNLALAQMLKALEAIL